MQEAESLAAEERGETDEPPDRAVMFKLLSF